MDYYEKIADNFQSTIETIALSVDNLAEPIERACELITAALLADGKIIACGSGADAALAQLFVSNLLSSQEQERPALPALALGGDSVGVTAIAQNNGLNDIFCRQLRALGQPGDVLLCINSGNGANSLLRTVQAAHERNMGVVLLSNSSDSELGTLIRAEDIDLRVDALRQSQIIEIYVMVLNCFSSLIDQNLFGNFEQDQ